jgi:hypothetical protein
MLADGDDAACTVGRRPKAFNERNRDGGRFAGRLALWGFECRG